MSIKSCPVPRESDTVREASVAADPIGEARRDHVFSSRYISDVKRVTMLAWRKSAASSWLVTAGGSLVPAILR